VRKPAAFWDSSALVTLCVKQAFTVQAQSLESKYGMVVWWSTPVEILSALARMLRAGQMTEVQFSQAKVEADRMANLWQRMEPTQEIAARARNLLELHALRVADALQLAAAMEWCEGRPRSFVFLTFDRRLQEAARLTGFNLE
jgi:predicted nucleic acid-binding protein